MDLEENDDVINVTPMVTLDPRGGFLVADNRESQLRRYSASGRLLWHTGRKGDGPGEFSSLGRAVRLPSGEVLAVEWTGRVTVYDSSGGGPLRTLRSPFTNIEDLLVLDDSLLLVSAISREFGVAGPRLHVWNPSLNEVSRSFFTPMAGAVNPKAATVVTWTKVALRGDTIAAAFALSDTLFLFATSGRPVGAVPLSFGGFRRVGPETPAPTSDPARIAGWLSTFDYVSMLQWLADGRFVVIYQTVASSDMRTRTSHLFVMDRAGRALSEVRDVPRLMAADPQSGELFFVAPDHEAPNRWMLATLR